MTGKIFKYFQYQEFVGCVCMLNVWFSNIDDICADNYNFSRFKLKDKCRSEQWEVYLCGDMTIKVMMTIFAQTTTTFPRFTLKDKCRSEKWRCICTET